MTLIEGEQQAGYSVLAAILEGAAASLLHAKICLAGHLRSGELRAACSATEESSPAASCPAVAVPPQWMRTQPPAAMALPQIGAAQLMAGC